MTLNLAYNKSKLYKTLGYWSRDTLNSNFSEKGLGLVSPPHSVHSFSIKMFLVLDFINLPNFIVWWPLLLEILGNKSITIVCKPGYEVIKLEINLIFLIKPFCYMTKMSRQKPKYFENEKSFWREIKSIFHHFSASFRGFVAINCAFKIKYAKWSEWCTLCGRVITRENKKSILKLIKTLPQKVMLHCLHF